MKKVDTNDPDLFTLEELMSHTNNGDFKPAQDNAFEIKFAKAFGNIFVELAKIYNKYDLFSKTADKIIQLRYSLHAQHSKEYYEFLNSLSKRDKRSYWNQDSELSKCMGQLQLQYIKEHKLEDGALTVTEAMSLDSKFLPELEATGKYPLAFKAKNTLKLNDEEYTTFKKALAYFFFDTFELGQELSSLQEDDSKSMAALKDYSSILRAMPSDSEVTFLKENNIKIVESIEYLVAETKNLVPIGSQLISKLMRDTLTKEQNTQLCGLYNEVVDWVKKELIGPLMEQRALQRAAQELKEKITEHLNSTEATGMMYG